MSGSCRILTQRVTNVNRHWYCANLRAFHIQLHPAIGSPRYAHELDLPGLRCWQLKAYPYPKELLALGIRENRQVFFKPYRLIYRIAEQRVCVYLVVDGRRDMRALLAKRLLNA